MQRLNVVWAAAATVAVAACTDYESQTDLNPEGPPMVQQVYMKESFTAPNATFSTERDVFAFGTHPMALEEQNPCKNVGAGQACVNSAVVQGNSMRIIMDELLRGNNLEEINCRATVDDDAYQRIAVGTTPDDVARCAAPQDVLPRSCTGEFAVCICQLDTGCSVGSTMIAKGEPVGVTDINQDGAADDTRMAAGSVRVRCGSIDVPIDLDSSYWNPSGNQQVPAQGGFRALGPAIVLTPQRGMPTNITCQLEFAEDVTDKQDIRVCAPPGGDIGQPCSPGDMSNFTFKTEPMVFSTSVENNQMGVSRTTSIFFQSNTKLDPGTATGIVVTDLSTNMNLVMGTHYDIVVMMNQNIEIVWRAPGLAAGRMYRITAPVTVKDAFGQGLPAPQSITFTTAM